MSKPLLDRDSHQLDIQQMPHNCGMDVIAEFKGGHRYRGGYKEISSRPLTREEWLGILKHSYGGEAPEGNIWVVTGKKTQCKSVNDMSILGFISFLEQEGVKVIKSEIPKTPYNVYTIYPTPELRKAVKGVSLDDVYRKRRYYDHSSLYNFDY